MHNSKVCTIHIPPNMCCVFFCFVHSLILLHFFGKSSRLNSFAIPLLLRGFFSLFFLLLLSSSMCTLFLSLVSSCFTLLRFAFQMFNFLCFLQFLPKKITTLHDAFFFLEKNLCLKSIFYRSFVIAVIAVYVCVHYIR